MNPKYRVIITGINDTKHAKENVIADFAKLSSISHEKARIILSKERTVKKGIDETKANLLCGKLDRIGVLAIVEEELLEEDGLATLSLVPLDNEPPTEVTEVLHTDESGLSLAPLEKNSEATLPRQPEETLQSALNSNDRKNSNQHNSQQSVENENINHLPRRRKAPVKQGFFDGINLFNIIAGSIAAVIGAMIWTNFSISYSNEANWMAIVIGAMVGFAVLMTGTSGMPSGTLAAVLAIAGMLLARQMTFIGIEDNIMDGIRDEQRQLLERRQMLLADYDPNMSNEGFVAFYRHYIDGPIDRKYRLGPRESSQEIIQLRPNFESQIDNILAMSYEDMQPQFDAVMTELKPLLNENRPEFWGTVFMMYIAFGAITAFRLGMGFD